MHLDISIFLLDKSENTARVCGFSNTNTRMFVYCSGNVLESMLEVPRSRLGVCRFFFQPLDRGFVFFGKSVPLLMI